MNFKNIKYDFLIVGAGLYGAIFAYEAKKMGVCVRLFLYAKIY